MYEDSPACYIIRNTQKDEELMNSKFAALQAGVYVDVENIVRNGGRGMRFDTLRDYSRRDGADAIRLNAYLALDERDAQRDIDYRTRATRYHFAVHNVGFKVIEKQVEWYTSEDGIRVSKANSNLDLAMDMLLHVGGARPRGPGFRRWRLSRWSRALQNMGCPGGTDRASRMFSRLAAVRATFTVFPGYLIPGMLHQLLKSAESGASPARGMIGACYVRCRKGARLLGYLGRLGQSDRHRYP